MDRELDEKLVGACPNLYRQRNGDIRQSAMPFGFECSSGWFDLIWELSLKLEKLIVETIPDEDKWETIDVTNIYNKFNKGETLEEYIVSHPWFRGNPTWDEETKTYKINNNPRHMVYCSQCKEKWSKLRFYMSMETDEMSVLIREAEIKSGKICETCGKPGKVRDTGWVRTLCNKHYKEHTKNENKAIH